MPLPSHGIYVYFFVIYVYMQYVYMSILESGLFLPFLNFSGHVVIIQTFLELIFGHLVLKLNCLTITGILTYMYIYTHGLFEFFEKLQYDLGLLFFIFSGHIVTRKKFWNSFLAIKKFGHGCCDHGNIHTWPKHFLFLKNCV